MQGWYLENWQGQELLSLPQWEKSKQTKNVDLLWNGEGDLVIASTDKGFVILNIFASSSTARFPSLLCLGTGFKEERILIFTKDKSC